MPEDIIGDIPSSIKVPRLLANIILSQYKGSDVSEDTIPYNLMKLIARQCYIKQIYCSKSEKTHGIWLMTKKMSNVNYSKKKKVNPTSFPSNRPNPEEEGEKLTPVHITRCLNGVLRSGLATSGRIGTNGLMRSRKRTVGKHVLSVKFLGIILFLLSHRQRKTQETSLGEKEWALTAAHDCEIKRSLWEVNRKGGTGKREGGGRGESLLKKREKWIGVGELKKL